MWSIANLPSAFEWIARNYPDLQPKLHRKHPNYHNALLLENRLKRLSQPGIWTLRSEFISRDGPTIPPIHIPDNTISLSTFYAQWELLIRERRHKLPPKLKEIIVPKVFDNKKIEKLVRSCGAATIFLGDITPLADRIAAPVLVTDVSHVEKVLNEVIDLSFLLRPDQCVSFSQRNTTTLQGEKWLMLIQTGFKHEYSDSPDSLTPWSSIDYNPYIGRRLKYCVRALFDHVLIKDPRLLNPSGTVTCLPNMFLTKQQQRIQQAAIAKLGTSSVKSVFTRIYISIEDIVLPPGEIEPDAATILAHEQLLPKYLTSGPVFGGWIIVPTSVANRYPPGEYSVTSMIDEIAVWICEVSDAALMAQLTMLTWYESAKVVLLARTNYTQSVPFLTAHMSDLLTPHRRWFIIGNKGCGKTRLMKLMVTKGFACMDSDDVGRILYMITDGGRKEFDPFGVSECVRQYYSMMNKEEAPSLFEWKMAELIAAYQQLSPSFIMPTSPLGIAMLEEFDQWYTSLNTNGALKRVFDGFEYWVQSGGPDALGVSHVSPKIAIFSHSMVEAYSSTAAKALYIRSLIVNPLAIAVRSRGDYLVEYMLYTYYSMTSSAYSTPVTVGMIFWYLHAAE
ncbi:putative kinase [Sclerotinia sclerotiorum reovirus 1]|nr:putative kinase [Sclerotinia sclerotiorum reovirus 1]